MHFVLVFFSFIAASAANVFVSIAVSLLVSVSVSSIRIDGSAIVLVFQFSFNDSSLVSLKINETYGHRTGKQKQGSGEGSVIR